MITSFVLKVNAQLPYTNKLTKQIKPVKYY